VARDPYALSDRQRLTLRRLPSDGTYVAHDDLDGSARPALPARTGAPRPVGFEPDGPRDELDRARAPHHRRHHRRA